MPEETKPIWRSKTIIGLAMMVIGLIVKQFNLPISTTEIATVIAFILEGVGGILVFVGRLKADKKIG